MLPSGSTMASAIGGMLALFISLFLQHVCGITLTTDQGVILGGGMAALAGYFFKGGKATDMQAKSPQLKPTENDPQEE